MLRMIRIQGPYEAIDAVVAIGNEGLLAFQDYFHDQEKTHSVLLTIFDDTIEAEEDVLEQARTLLAEKGIADPSTFRVTRRFLHYPDALEYEWYVRLEHDFAMPLLALEALGVRGELQQIAMDKLREEITRRVAGASELAEANIATFVTKVNDLLNRPVTEEGEADEGEGIVTSAVFGQGFLVKVEYNTQADGTPVDESVPGEYPHTLHGPFDTEEEAVAWMDAYPDDDTDLHDIFTITFNRVR